MLFAINLYLSNIVYMHLSVALIQMIKAITPCFVLGVAFCMNIESVTFRLAAAIVIISAGVLLSTCGADEWQTFGVTIQLGAILADAVQLNLAEISQQGRHPARHAVRHSPAHAALPVRRMVLS